MHLTPREKDKLIVAMAAMVARRRLERGVKLNHPEAGALVTAFVPEGPRHGRSVAERMRHGATVPRLGPGMAGIPQRIPESPCRATFPAGTKLVAVPHP